MHKNPVDWFEVYVNDLEKAKNFYQAVLQINLEPLSDPTNENIEMLAFPSNF